MPSYSDIYCKFGETSEAAQLLEIELGTFLLVEKCTQEDLLGKDGTRASEIMEKINRQTLGSLIKSANNLKISEVEIIADQLEAALEKRNVLAHSFYRLHNMRIHSDEGRLVMMSDLNNIHKIIFDAYKQLMLLRGIDLDLLSQQKIDFPTKHLPI